MAARRAGPEAGGAAAASPPRPTRQGRLEDVKKALTGSYYSARVTSRGEPYGVSGGVMFAAGAEVEYLWTRDREVLANLHLQLRAHGKADVGAVSGVLGVSSDEVVEAVGRLHRANYLQVQTSAGEVAANRPFRILRLTERGLRATGAWPAEGQEAAEVFLAALQRAVSQERDPEKRKKLTALRDAAMNLGTGALAGFLGDVAGSVAGLD